MDVLEEGVDVYFVCFFLGDAGRFESVGFFEAGVLLIFF